MMQFDTHKAYKRFKDAGIEDKAADAFVEAINDARATDLENLATKHDLMNIKSELKQEISDIKSELKENIHALDLEISDVKSDVKLLKWMTGFSIGLSVAILIKLFLN